VAGDLSESVFGGIGVSGVEKRLHIEIAIGDFPTWSEPLIGGTRGERSRGVGVRHFGIFVVERIAAGGVPKLRNAIAIRLRVEWRTGVRRLSLALR
jgi:hypothetical protein